MDWDEERGTQHGSSNWNRFMSTGKVDDYLRYRECMNNAAAAKNVTGRSTENGGTVDLDGYDIGGFSC